MSRAIALTIAAALVLAAGCGGGGAGGPLSKREYEAKMGSIVQELDSVPSTLGSFSSTDFKAAGTYFQRLGGTFDRLHGELERVEPPRDVQTLHGRLVDGTGRAAEALHGLASRLENASAAERRRILTNYGSSTALLSALNDVEQAAGAIAAKGYRFRSSAGT